MRLNSMSLFKSTTAMIATAFVATAAVAAVFTIDDVNQRVSTLTSRFNTVDSAMSLEFTSLAVDDVRATDFGVKAFFKKTSTDNEVVLDVKSAEYAYGDGQNPTAKLDASLKFDVVKALGQAVVNELADEIDKIVLEIASQQTAEYGPAATVDAKVTDKQVDANGDVESIKMTLSAAIDLSQLPASKPLNEEEFKSVELSVSAARTGFEINLSVVMNPDYRRFNAGDIGLKEYIERLLADDISVYEELLQFLGMIDSFANWLLSMKAE